jgi:hypothetical protein
VPSGLNAALDPEPKIAAIRRFLERAVELR